MRDRAAATARRRRTQPGDPATEPFDLDGPSLTDHTLPGPAVPRLGHRHLHRTTSASRRRACRRASPACRCRPAARSRSSARRRALDANGCPWQNLSIQTTLKLSANAEAKGAKAGGSLAAYLGQATKYQVTVTPGHGRRHRRRRPPAAQPGRPEHDRQRARASSSPRTSTPASTPRAPTARSRSRWATTRAPRLERRQAHQPDDRAGDGRRRGLRPQRAQARRRLERRRASRSATPRTSATASCTRSTSTSRTRPAGTPTRRSSSSGRLPKPGTPGTLNPTQGRDGRLHGRHRSSRPSSAGSSSAGAAQRLRGPLDRDRRTPTARSTRHRTSATTTSSIAITTKEDADGNPIGTPTLSLLLHDVAPVATSRRSTSAPGQDAAGGPAARTSGSTSPRRSSSSCSRLALEQLADQVELNRDGRPTNEEIAQSLRENHGVVKFNGVEYAFGGLESVLGEARNAGRDADRALPRRLLSPNNVIEELALLARRPAARAAGDDQPAKLLTASAKTSV